MPTEDARHHFCETVLAAFARAGNFTDLEVARAGGPSSSTMTKLRAETINAPRSDTFARIDKAAGWAPGSARRLWNGHDPVGGPTHDVGHVASPGDRADGGKPENEVLSEIRAMREEQRRMSERLARVEERLAES